MFIVNIFGKSYISQQIAPLNTSIIYRNVLQMRCLCFTLRRQKTSKNIELLNMKFCKNVMAQLQLSTHNFESKYSSFTHKSCTDVNIDMFYLGNI